MQNKKPINKLDTMTLGELSVVFTTLAVSPIGLSRLTGVPVKEIKEWILGEKAIPHVAVRFMRLLVLHPEIIPWIKETAIYKF